MRHNPENPTKSRINPSSDIDDIEYSIHTAWMYDCTTLFYQHSVPNGTHYPLSSTRCL